MDVSVKSDAGLEVSISFGKFENDALSWEKWSSFSPNKYLEEVGSLSTPGSVAQKKAYFEAHYKKIAAKKAKESEQEEKSAYPSTSISSSNLPCKAASVECSSDTDVKLGSFSNGLRLTEVITEETCGSVSSDASEADVGNNAAASNGLRSVEEALSSVTISDGVKDNSFEGVDQGVSINGLIDGISIHEEKANGAIVVESVERSKDHLSDVIVDAELKVSEAKCVSVETRKISKKLVSKTPERKKGTERPNSLNKEKPKLNSRNLAQKVTPIKEKDAAAAKRKVAAPSAKSLQASNPRQAKPTFMSTSLSSAQSLKKKTNSSPLPKSKDPMEGKIKKTAPSSLHMSLSLGPTNSSSSSSIPMTRKSLIMERMGDKDIVKRAFKAFQNRSNGSSADERQVKVPSPASEPKVATSHSHGKVNEGLGKDAKKQTISKSASSIRSSPLPSSRKSFTSISPASGLRSNEKAEKRQEFLKKLEARSIARAAENARTRAKSKEDKISGIKRLTQSLNIKGKSMQSFNEDQEKRH